MLKILVNEGPRAPLELSREIPLLEPKTNPGGALGAELVARLGTPSDKYFWHDVGVQSKSAKTVL